MKKLIGARVAFAALCTTLLTLIGAGSATAAPVYTTSFNFQEVPYGYSNGHLYYYNRSVQVQGTAKSNTTGCVQARFNFYSGNPADLRKPVVPEQTRTACGRGTGTSTDFNFTVDQNIQISMVSIELWENTSGSWSPASGTGYYWNCAVVSC